MNSNRLIDVDKVWCGQCREVFYELRDYELSECPHCKRPLNDPDVEHNHSIRIEVDFKTGEVKINKK